MVQVLKGQKRHAATSEIDPNVIGYVSLMMAEGHMMIAGNFVRKCMTCVNRLYNHLALIAREGRTE